MATSATFELSKASVFEVEQKMQNLENSLKSRKLDRDAIIQKQASSPEATDEQRQEMDSARIAILQQMSEAGADIARFDLQLSMQGVRRDVQSATVEVQSATVEVQSATLEVKSATLEVKSAAEGMKSASEVMRTASEEMRSSFAAKEEKIYQKLDLVVETIVKTIASSTGTIIDVSATEFQSQSIKANQLHSLLRQTSQQPSTAAPGTPAFWVAPELSNPKYAYAFTASFLGYAVYTKPQGEWRRAPVFDGRCFPASSAPSGYTVPCGMGIMTERRCRNGSNIVITIREFADAGPTSAEILLPEEDIYQCALAKFVTENLTAVQRKAAPPNAEERYLLATRVFKTSTRGGASYNIKWINKYGCGKFQHTFPDEDDRSEKMTYTHKSIRFVLPDTLRPSEASHSGSLLAMPEDTSRPNVSSNDHGSAERQQGPEIVSEEAEVSGAASSQQSHAELPGSIVQALGDREDNVASPAETQLPGSGQGQPACVPIEEDDELHEEIVKAETQFALTTMSDALPQRLAADMQPEAPPISEAEEVHPQSLAADMRPEASPIVAAEEVHPQSLAADMRPEAPPISEAEEVHPQSLAADMRPEAPPNSEADEVHPQSLAADMHLEAPPIPEADEVHPQSLAADMQLEAPPLVAADEVHPQSLAADMQFEAAPNVEVGEVQQQSLAADLEFEAAPNVEVGEVQQQSLQAKQPSVAAPAACLADVHERFGEGVTQASSIFAVAPDAEVLKLSTSSDPQLSSDVQPQHVRLAPMADASVQDASMSALAEVPEDAIVEPRSPSADWGRTEEPAPQEAASEDCAPTLARQARSEQDSGQCSVSNSEGQKASEAEEQRVQRMEGYIEKARERAERRLERQKAEASFRDAGALPASQHASQRRSFPANDQRGRPPLKRQRAVDQQQARHSNDWNSWERTHSEIPSCVTSVSTPP